jgi:hypothetical protein
LTYGRMVDVLRNKIIGGGRNYERTNENRVDESISR